MSAVKIAELLRQGAMIDINLMSDSLKSILGEICEIVTDQGEEIKFLKAEMKKFASKTQINEAIASVREDALKATLNVQKISTDLNTMSTNVMTKLNTMQNSCSQQMNTLRNEVSLETETRLKEIKGEYFITTQQIKSMQGDITELKTQLKATQQEEALIKKMIDDQKDQTLELIAVRVDQLEKGLQAETEKTTKIKTEHDEELSKLKKSSTKFQGDVHNELHYVNGELKEIRRLVVEAPSFDVEGQVDTETLIHAIQRDSRRIDNFNEIIVSVRDQNDELSALFNSLSGCFQNLQLQLHDFVAEHNIIKNSLVDQIDQCYVNTENVRHEVGVVQSNVDDAANVIMKNMTTISATFYQLYQFLSKVTTRPLPAISTFDQELLECQNFQDAVQMQKDSQINYKILEKCLIKKDHINSQLGEFLTTDTLFHLTNEFQISFIGVPALESKRNKRKSMFANEYEKEVVVQIEEPSYSTVEQLETRQSVQDLQRIVQNLQENYSTIRDHITQSIEMKADMTSVERMLDKVRSIHQKMQNSVSSIQKRVFNCIQRDEFNEFVTSTINNVPKTNSAGNNPNNDLICVGRGSIIAESSGNTSILPRLETPEKSFNAIYGKTPQKYRMQSSSLMKRQYSTPPPKKSLL